MRGPGAGELPAPHTCTSRAVKRGVSPAPAHAAMSGTPIHPTKVEASVHRARGTGARSQNPTPQVAYWPSHVYAQTLASGRVATPGKLPVASGDHAPLCGTCGPRLSPPRTATPTIPQPRPE